MAIVINDTKYFKALGIEALEMATHLWPFLRSLTGNGNKKTLEYIAGKIDLNRYSFKSGEKHFDWIVPNQWECNSATLKDVYGNTTISAEDNNLHVLNYSQPINERVSLSELKSHLYSIPHMPDAIPYLTSYYENRWGRGAVI